MLVVGCFGLFAASFFISETALIGTGLSVLGLIFWGVAVYLGLETVRCTTPADGTIVGFEERLEEQDENERKCSIAIGPFSWSFGPKEERRVSYFPRVEFETKDHEKRVFTSDDGSQKLSYHVGEAVRVLYDPARPQVARIDKPNWTGIVAVDGVGAFFSVFGLRYLLESFGFWE